MDLHFPNNFFWGTATSAYQIEGGITNDWEVSNKVPHAGRATDHWNRWQEDFDRAAGLNTDAYRFSIEWARVEPKKGVVDSDVLAQYRAMIDGLRERGLEPFVTLHHFTHPVWFVESGGWLGDDAIARFARFVETTVSSLGERVRFWCTVNEPLVYVALAHVWNTFPAEPGKWRAYHVAKRLREAHRTAYRAVKRTFPNAQAGIVKNNRPVYASGIKRVARPIADWAWNHWFLQSVRNETDFIGLNYYHPSVMGVASLGLANAPETDMGWKVWPQGFYETAMALKRYHKPIYITENGLADHNDNLRARFIVRHLAALHRAIRNGADVRGYFYWSLLDNFEWAHGFDKRFGLLEINYETLERTKRPSADVYAEICRRNAVPEEFLERHTIIQ